MKRRRFFSTVVHSHVDVCANGRRGGDDAPGHPVQGRGAARAQGGPVAGGGGRRVPRRAAGAEGAVPRAHGHGAPQADEARGRRRRRRRQAAEAAAAAEGVGRGGVAGAGRPARAAAGGVDLPGVGAALVLRLRGGAPLAQAGLARARRPDPHAARRDRDARLRARRDERRAEGARRAALARRRHAAHVLQHVPPARPPGARDCAAGGRPPRLHEPRGPADHRLRRLPGLLPRGALRRRWP